MKDMEDMPQKGNCSECSHYTDCPRMKGIDFCYSLTPNHQLQPIVTAEHVVRKDKSG
jgi:hypothetical protein